MGEGTLALHASHLESQVLWALEPGVAFAPLRGLELAVAADLGLGTFSTLTFDHLGFAAHYAVVAGAPVSFAPGASLRLCFDSSTCPDLPSSVAVSSWWPATTSSIAWSTRRSPASPGSSTWS